MLSTKGKYLYKDGKRLFYLADTCWGAFTSVEMADWRYYLDVRKSEGFNAIQINVLRQWDSSKPLEGREPFAITEHTDGTYEYNFSKINEDYFDNAEKMLIEMKKRNMIPSLVLLWSNFVPDNWIDRYKAAKNNLMPFNQIRPYITYVVNRLKKFNPIWFVSGDVGFTDNEKQDPKIAIKYYREVLRVAKEIDPNGIYTFHINGESHDLPDEFVNQINFYSYQSGHGYAGQSTAYKIPACLREKQNYVGPIIDTELCYEGLTQMHAPEPKRYGAFDVRKAAWSAVLSGADAGLGYGSFGIWPWKDISRPEQELEQNFNVQLVPYDWRTCLTFRGAQDLGFLKDILTTFAPEKLKSISLDENDPIRGAKGKNYVLIYLPTAGNLDFSKFKLKVDNCKVIDLNKRTILEGRVENNVLQMMPIVEDELVIVKNTKLN